MRLKASSPKHAVAEHTASQLCPSKPSVHWNPPTAGVHDPEAADVPVMLPEYPVLHTQSPALPDRGGLSELGGQSLHSGAAPVSALNVPPGQSTQVELFSVDTSHVAPVNPASHTHTP